MKKIYYIGADMGTTNIKVCAYDKNAEELATASRHCDTKFVGQAGALQFPEQWWNNFAEAVREVADAIPEGECRTVSISSHVPALVPVGSDGGALRPAMIWQDFQAVSEAEELKNEKWAPLLAANNPAAPLPYHFISKLLWFIRHEPELYEKTWKFLQPKDFLSFKLTGRPVWDNSQSGFNHLYNVFEDRIDPVLTQSIDPNLMEKIPEVVPADSCIGTVLPEIAASLHISPETKVFAGGTDTAAAILGSNVYHSGEIALSLGTGANMVMTCMRENMAHFSREVSFVRHAAGPAHLSLCTTSNAGNILDWYLQNVAGQFIRMEEDGLGDRYALAASAAGKSVPGANGVLLLPYITGENAPIYDVNARGVFFGLSATSNECDMARAVLESMCYSIRHTLEFLMENCGVARPESVNVSGGQTKMPLWMQILADILHMRVEIYTGITPAPRGNAMVGIVGTNPGLDYDQFKGPCTSYTPNPKTYADYDRRFEQYKDLYLKLKDTFSNYLNQEIK